MMEQSGYNVAPAEVERAAVVGVPDPIREDFLGKIEKKRRRAMATADFEAGP